MKNKPFKKALDDWLENHGGSQDELKKGTGIRQQTISAICRGVSHGSLDSQKKISEYVAGSFDKMMERGRELINKENNRPPPVHVTAAKALNPPNVCAFTPRQMHASTARQIAPNQNSYTSLTCPAKCALSQLSTSAAFKPSSINTTIESPIASNCLNNLSSMFIKS